MAGQKKFQYVLASIGTLLLFRVLYYTDPNFLKFEGHNLIFLAFQYIVILPILLWIVVFTNKWLYEKFVGNSNLKVIITYSVFQKLFTIYHFVLVLILIYGNYKWVN
jgi:hypothetical protein